MALKIDWDYAPSEATVLDWREPDYRPIPRISRGAIKALTDKYVSQLPDAGSFDDDGFYDYDTDRYMPGRLLIDCPYCSRRHRPLLGRFTRVVDSGWQWVGLSHQEPYTNYVGRCTNSRDVALYRFQTRTPQ